MPASRFHISIDRPEDIIPKLGKGERHWKVGRSAYELAYSWFSAPGIPATVTQVLDQASEYVGAELIDAFFERDTDLGTSGAGSQTDLLVLAKLRAGKAVIGVEGKVDETFGPVLPP